MLHTRSLTDLETQEIYETSKAGLERMKARVVLMSCLAAIMMLIYPYNIILAWYFPMMLLDFINFRYAKLIIDARSKKAPLNAKFLYQYFILSWSESLCMVALVIAVSIHEGQIPHFIPYLILLCASIYIATSTFQNAVLMFGHLTLYNLTLLFVSARDVFVSYPNTTTPLWVQFFASVLIVVFLTDSYLFFRGIHIESRKKSLQLEQARKQAEKLTQQKSDLISAIGHELRTPLNGILGFSQIIKRTELSEKQQEYVNLIEGAGKDLHLLLSNILDSENLEQGRLHLRLIDTDIRVLLNRTVRLFEAAAQEKDIALGLEIDSDVPTHILTDETRLGQCISNLLSNAVRFTTSGGVMVRVHFATRPVQKLSISVTDTGIGIPQDQRHIIFDKFVQGSAPSGLQSGTGMGLWLVQSIAKAMNGTLILLKSSPAGSEFLLEFELETQVLIPTTGSVPLANKRILHIEDTQTNLMLIRYFLEEKGVIVTEAITGADAMDLLQNNEFDAILCDLRLPDCNGNQLLSEIRALDNKNAQIPVIALTAQPEMVGHDNGFTAILSKPIDRQLLIVTLSQLYDEDLSL